MLKTLLKAVGLMAFLAWFGFASAANMGGINVTSALGHPLQAEISLAEMGQYDKSQLNAKLASVNEFKSAGIDYPYSLPKLSFSFETRSNGVVYLKLLSTQPVNEPFVSILVELSWPSGKLLREYTFLLDPAGFVAEQPKVAEVKPVEPVVPILAPMSAEAPMPIAEAEPLPVEPMPAAVAVLPLDEEKTEPVLSDMAKAELAAEKLAAADAASTAESVGVAPSESATADAPEAVKVEPLAPAEVVATADLVLVEKGDTLGKIAKELKPVDVSLERMLVAMYRANAKKFDGRNMNRIRTGKVLRMPEASEIDNVTQAAAVREIRAQVADWQDYRQKLAATQSAPDETAPKQEATGKISAAVAEKAPVVKESAKEVLRLSKGESLGDKAVAGGAAKTKQDNADDAAAKAKQLQEDKKKIADLESISKGASKLVELKSQPAATSGDAAAAASAPAATKKVPATSVAPVPVVAEEDILTTITDALADPIVLGGVVALLLALGGLGFVISRRGKGTQKKSSKKVEDVGSATGSWRTPVAPSPDTGDFTQAATATASQSANSPAPMAVAAIDDVDPISEADLFLNFGRDTSAEEILKDALVKTPTNNQVKLKLLSIYVNRKDSKSFSKYAQEVKDSGDAAAWERAAVMGREIDPTNPTYGGAKGETRNREAAKPEVDFDLGMGGVSEPAFKTPAKDMMMDFDLSGAQPSISESSEPLFAKPKPVTPAKATADVDATSILSRADLNAALAVPPSSSPMDFDVSGILPGEVKQMAESKTMDFDISGIMSDDIKSSSQSSSMDFDLTGSQPGIPAMEPESSPATSAMNFNDLVFEIPTSESKPVEPMSAPVSSADEGMAFTIDFPTGGNFEEPLSKSTPANKVDIDFGSIDINFDNEPAPVSADGKDDQWHEVATKLDLAKAYQEMGDADGAREILEEVMRDGDNDQKESAEKLMQQITA